MFAGKRGVLVVTSPSESSASVMVSTHVRLLFCLFLAVQFRKMRGIPQRTAPPRSRTSILALGRERPRPARRPLVREQMRAGLASSKARRSGLLRPDLRPAAAAAHRSPGACYAPPRTHGAAPWLGTPIGKRCCFLRKGPTMERMHLEQLAAPMGPYLPAGGHARISKLLSVQARFTHRSRQTRKAPISLTPRRL